MGKQCCPMGKLALVLLVVGGLNWGLVGAFNFDLVNFIFVQNLGMAMIARIVYILVGVSALFIGFKKLTCNGGSCSK